MAESIGIAGSGTIATGLAACASTITDVTLWARSERSAERARAAVDRAAGKLDGADSGRVTVTTGLDDLGDATYLIEAIVEDHACKCGMLSALAEIARRGESDAVLATTTSSLSISDLAVASGNAERFVGFHVFNPVPRMPLVELVYTEHTSEATRRRTRQLCSDLQKTAVEVPDTAGFVVNRLLFPYLFDAIELMTSAGLSPEDVDNCMTLGAGLPMGPLALLDFVGLDVSKAIGDSIGLKAPPAMESLIRDNALGRKTARGFYSYS